MAFKYRQKKTIRRKRRFLKRKGAKTYGRARKGIMTGGVMRWKVNVNCVVTNNEATQFKQTFLTTPGIFSLKHSYAGNDNFEHIVGDLTVPEFGEFGIFPEVNFIKSVNKYQPVGMLVLSNDPITSINHFIKESEFSQESATSTAHLPTSGISRESKPSWWRLRTVSKKIHPGIGGK